MDILQDIVSNFYQQQQNLGVADNNKMVTTAVTTATAVFIYYVIRNMTINRNKNDPTPTVPYHWPIIGSSAEYFKDKKKFAKEKTELYGPVFRVHLLGQICTVVGGNYAHEVFMNPNLDFVESSQKYFDISLVLNDLNYEFSPQMFRDFIIKEITHKLSKYSCHFDEQCTNVAAEMFGNLTEPKIITDVNKLVRTFVARTTAFTLGGTFFTENKELLYLLESLADECSSQFLMPNPARALLPWWNTLYKNIFYPRNTYAKESIQKIRNNLKSEVRQRIDIIHNKNERQAPDDVLQFILKEYFKDKEENEILDGLTAWFFSMTFLSVLTTSGVLIAIIHILATSPQYVSELLEEQEQVIQQDNNTTQSLNAADYKKLVKLDSFIREAFRHMDDFDHPHVNTSKDNVVLSNGTVIRPGEEVFTNFWHVNFDPSIQSDLQDLEEFKPFRFVGREKQSTKCSADYLPFGLGRHACPGRWFAVEEIKAIVSVIIRNYELSPVSTDDEKKGVQFINRQKK